MGDPFEAELDERLLEENTPARLALEDELRSLIYEKASEMSVMHPASSHVSPSDKPDKLVIDYVNVIGARWESESGEVVVTFEVKAHLDVDYQLEHDGEVLNKGSDVGTWTGSARAALCFRDVTLGEWKWGEIEDDTPVD